MKENKKTRTQVTVHTCEVTLVLHMEDYVITFMDNTFKMHREPWRGLLPGRPSPPLSPHRILTSLTAAIFLWKKKNERNRRREGETSYSPLSVSSLRAAQYTLLSRFLSPTTAAAQNGGCSDVWRHVARSCHFSSWGRSLWNPPVWGREVMASILLVVVINVVTFVQYQCRCN